jgi:hypothetical protein
MRARLKPEDGRTLRELPAPLSRYALAVAGINRRECERLNRAQRRFWNLERPKP